MLPFTKVSTACGRIAVLCYHLIEAMCVMVRKGKEGGGSESEQGKRRRQITEMSYITDMQYWSQVHTLYIHVRPMMCYIHTLSILVWEELC